MHSKLRLPRSGMALPALLGGLVLLVGAPLAIAHDPAHPAAGVLHLPNVTLQAASARQIAEASKSTTSSQPAVRAYKDPVSGELRDQTPEEMMEGGHAKSAVDHPKSAPVRSPSGGTLIELDESFMINSVVTKDAEGKLSMQCVNGEKSALDVLRNGKAGKAHRHDR